MEHRFRPLSFSSLCIMSMRECYSFYKPSEKENRKYVEVHLKISKKLLPIIALQSSKASNYTCRGPRSTQDIKGGKMNRKHGPSGLYRMASALGRLCTCNKITAIQTNPLSQLFMHTHLFSSLLPLSLAHSPNNSLSFWVYSLGKTYPLQLFMVCRLKLLSL